MKLLAMERDVLRSLREIGAKHFRQYITVGQTDKFRFIIMSLVGKSLEDLLRVTGHGTARSKKFALNTALFVGIETLESVQELHKIGYVCFLYFMYNLISNLKLRFLSFLSFFRLFRFYLRTSRPETSKFRSGSRAGRSPNLHARFRHVSTVSKRRRFSSTCPETTNDLATGVR